MKKKNEVTGPYRAIVNGESTALAGCSNEECQKESCLRSSDKLMLQESFTIDSKGYCGQFIAVG